MISELVTGLVNPAVKLIDELHTSDEEKAMIKQKLQEAQMQMSAVVLQHEQRNLELQSSVIKAEAGAKGTALSGLTQSWRPITMLTLLGLIVADTFGLTAVPLNENAWTLIHLGLGGYVVGRSAEKVMQSMKGK